MANRVTFPGPNIQLLTEFSPLVSGGSVSLNSPAFTGLPTAPTQPASDSSTLVATTGYVTRAISNTVLSTNVTIISTGATYICVNTDRYIIVKKTIGSILTVTLPVSPTSGALINLKDGNGQAHSFNITVTSSSGLIDGNANMVMDQPYESLTFLYNGTDWNVF